MIGKSLQSKETRLLKPMLARLVDRPFSHSNWVFEIKYDGYRAIADVHEGKVKLYSRNLKSFNQKYPALVEELKRLSFDVVFDGEITVIDEQGRPNFEWLQNYDREPKGRLVYYLFDLLFYAGTDLRMKPLLERKRLLKDILPKKGNLVYSEHVEEKGTQFYREAEKLGLEGIMAKRKDSIYEDGRRSNKWFKIKITKRQEAIICGYTQPKGKRWGFGSLILGVYGKNEQLCYIGRAGTGFSESDIHLLMEKFKGRERKTCPFALFPESEKNITWLKPELVAEVKFSEWTRSGVIRHSVFMGLREDKPPAEISFESPEPVEEAIPGFSEKELQFTNRDKIFWPEQGYTKGDVIDYYNKIASFILPYLRDRPQSLRRNPRGIQDQGFFQKNVEGLVPPWIQTTRIFSGSNEEYIEYMLCQNKAALLFMANWGCIEMNPWSSRIGSLDNPDYFIFDLDPLEIEFQAVVQVALLIKEILDKMKVPAYCKTSGGRGLHVYVPAGAQYSYDQTLQFVHLVELWVHQRLPEMTSMERAPSKRKGRVYLDYLQNGRGKTMASVYSLRPKKGAPVSTPLEWKEVNQQLDPFAFNMETMPERLNEKGDLWENILNEKVDLADALQRLQFRPVNVG